MNKVYSKISSILAMVAAFFGKKATKLTTASLVAAPVLVGGTAHATTPADPLDGAGTDMVDALLSNFTTYVIPAVVSVIVAVYAWKLIVKLGTRFLNRA